MYVEGVFKPFHKKFCPDNDLSSEAWEAENNRRNSRLLKSFNKEIQFFKEADKMSYKDLADYMIENIHFKAGTMEHAVVNKVIEILFKLYEEKDKE